MTKFVPNDPNGPVAGETGHGNPLGPPNEDNNEYGFKKGKRDAQGYKGPVGVYHGSYTDNSDDEGWTDSPLADSRLVRGGWRNTLSGAFAQPKFTDFAGGKSAPKARIPRDNKASQ